MGDPVAATLAVGVATNMISKAVEVAAQHSWRGASAEGWVLPRRDDLEKAGEWLSGHLATELPTEEYQSYLASVEFASTLDMILQFHIARRDPVSDTTLREAFQRGYHLHHPRGRHDDFIWSCLLLVAAELIPAAFGSTATRTESAVTASANSAIHDMHLQSIERRLATLSGDPGFDAAEMTTALTSYEDAARVEFSKIQPPNFDGADKVRIDDIYVTPNITLPESDSRSIGLGDISSLRRVVILGDPGGGKTTLSRKVAHDLLESRYAETRNTTPLPFVLVLRDYGAYLKTHSGSIADFMEDRLRVVYQVAAPKGFVPWTLATGEWYVILDGLDELLDTSLRQIITQAIESFAAVHSNIRILVTSRRVGYRLAPLDTDRFILAELGAFDTAGVAKYVDKWFDLVPDITATDRARLVRSFMHESSIVDDLRRNPLMLALMCSIYRTESYIPRNRPDVYEKCSRMLFDRWDRHRGLLEPFEFEAHVDPALMHLAYTIYDSPEFDSGILETQLVGSAAEYLSTWQYEDTAKSMSAARSFIEFCRGRAWVFTDIGTTPDGEALYQFTHRTFLEYFTAAHLARTVDSIDALCRMLHPKIEKNEWDVVAQLALQIKGKAAQGGPDQVANTLILLSSAAESKNELTPKALNVLNFIARCSAFLILTPSTSQRLAQLLTKATLAIATPTSGQRDRSAGTLLAPLRSAARETRERLNAEVSGYLLRTLQAGPEQNADFEWACATAFYWTDHSFDQEAINGEASEILNLLREEARSQLKSHREWLWAAVAATHHGDLSASELLNSHGDSAIFAPVRILGAGSYYLTPIATALIALRSGDPSIAESRQELADTLEEYAAYILRNAPIVPPVDETFVSFVRDEEVRNDLDHAEMELPGATLLNGALLFAAFLEAGDREGQVVDWRQLSAGGFGYLDPYAPYFQRRFTSDDVLLPPIEEGDGERLTTLRDWATQAFNFIQADRIADSTN